MMAFYDFVVYSEYERSAVKNGIIAQARRAIKHTEEAQGVDTKELIDFLRPKIMLQQPIKEINFALTFGHSINPAYASIYFVYQYSLVYSCDLFSEF